MKIAIYHTTDLHGYVFPTDYVNYKEQGMLKILSFIDEDKKSYDNSLILDGGDLIQGSAMTNYLYKHEFDINPITNLVREAEYNAVILGNHEFNYGLDYLYKSYKSIQDLLLNANIEGLDLESKPYRIFDLDGTNISVFGITTSYIPNWEQAKNIEGIVFHDPVEMYAKYEKEMIDNSDYIIVLYHGGFEKSIDGKFIPTEKLNKENQASELLEKFESIDIILSGHQHRSFITKINDVICSQPLNNGQNFTKIVIDTESDDIEYELVDVTENHFTINEKYASLFDDINEKLDIYLKEIIGKLDKDILIDNKFEARLHGHPLINLLQEVQIEISGADFSTTTLFDTAIGFDKDVSIRDVLVNYPYPNTLRVLEIKGSDLKWAIEISSSYFLLDDEDNIIVNPKYIFPKKRNYKYDFFYGLDYVVDLKRPIGERVISMRRDGKDIDMDKNYSIVINNYRASNTTEYPPYEDKKTIKEINIDMSELLINYFEKHKEIKVNERVNFKFIK